MLMLVSVLWLGDVDAVIASALICTGISMHLLCMYST